MDSKETKKSSRKIKRSRALALLGIAVAAAYVVPTLTPLGGANASGGGSGGNKGGFFGGGSGGGRGGGLSSFGSGGRGQFIINDKVTATECAECHMAYGADALPQGSWKLIMGDLSNHFGEDASLDEATRKHVEDYLVANAPRGTGPLRISEARWFVSEHRGEVSPRKLKQAKSWANCEACH
ncbi:MAG: hypothetical protein KAI27_06145 [Rhodospirillaceae bacterium]|nr:hypothetical protein [Rhodospirillaceae bacterium]